MLLRPAFVIALVRDRRDDTGLVIVPADGLDLGEASEFGARAVGGDCEARAQHAPVGKPKLPDVFARSPTHNGPRDALNPEPVAKR
jgi:hypothetical protein